MDHARLFELSVVDQLFQTDVGKRFQPPFFIERNTGVYADKVVGFDISGQTFKPVDQLPVKKIPVLRKVFADLVQNPVEIVRRPLQDRAIVGLEGVFVVAEDRMHVRHRRDTLCNL